MDSLNGTITLFSDVIKGQARARARRRNPRLNAFLQEVEGILENYSRPENSGPGPESDAGADQTRTIKTEPESETQHSEQTADDFELKPDLQVKQELKSLPTSEPQSELVPVSRSNLKSELESPVQEPWGSAEGKVFRNDWILELILGYLDDGSITLLKCRYVNKRWNRISTRILNSRQLAGIHITYERSGFEIKRGKYPLALESDSFCNAFESTCRSGGHFPWNYFIIQHGSLNNRQLQSFLSKHGRIIKQLNVELSQLRAEIPDTLITDFKRLLVEQAPCIEVLTLGNFPKEWKNLRLFPEPKEELVGVLNNLREIHFASRPPTLVAVDLLEVSRRLRKIDRNGHSAPPTYYWEIFLNSRRVELLTRLEMNFPLSPTDNKLLWRLTERQPQLSHIEIVSNDLNWRGEESFGGLQEGFSIVSKFLESSSLTLTTLVIPQFILRKISPVPRLPKLKRLVLDKAANTSFSVDGNFSVAQYFPQMTDLAILFDRSPEGFNYWKDFFQDLAKHSLKSVRTLELHLTVQQYSLLLLTFINLDLKFPNMKQLTLRGICNFAYNATVLWTLARLQTLEINIDLHQNAGNEYPAIDAGFTGFSKETCCQLYESSDDGEISNLNELRESRSLLNMKCLETLTLVLTGFGRNELKPFISHVSGLFAFRMCPNLKVKLQVYADYAYQSKIENLLCPIYPYIQSADFNDRRAISRFLNIR